MATDQGKTSNLNALASAGRAARPAGAGDRADHLPPALHAGDLRGTRRRRPRCAVRPVAPHPAARLGRPPGRHLRGRRHLEAAPAPSPAAARPCTRRSRANAAPSAPAAASSTPAPWARSRSSGRTPASFSTGIYTGSFSRLAPGRCRYGVLLGEDGFVRDDGVIARLAPGPFPCHHHHRGRGRRVAPHGGLPPDRVPGTARLADLDDRAMGGDRAAGTARARHPGAAHRGHRLSPPCRR